MPHAAYPELGFSTEKAPKSDDFSAMVCALGVQVGEAHNGILKVCNTEKRMRETIGLLDDFMARGTLLKREALVLRGRLRFVTPLFSEDLERSLFRTSPNMHMRPPSKMLWHHPLWSQ